MGTPEEDFEENYSNDQKSKPEPATTPAPEEKPAPKEEA